MIILDSWTLFLKHKSDAFEPFKKLANVLQNQKRYTIIKIKSDYRGDFQNNNFVEFCENNGINHSFSTPRTLQ